MRWIYLKLHTWFSWKSEQNHRRSAWGPHVGECRTCILVFLKFHKQLFLKQTAATLISICTVLGFYHPTLENPALQIWCHWKECGSIWCWDCDLPGMPVCTVSYKCPAPVWFPQKCKIAYPAHFLCRCPLIPASLVVCRVSPPFSASLTSLGNRSAGGERGCRVQR